MTLGGTVRSGVDGDDHLTMAWVYLLVAGVFEVIWAASLKSVAGFTRLWPILLTATGLAGSLWFLALALKSLPIGTAYTVWTGLGVVGTVLAGIVLYREAYDFGRLFWLLMIAIGILGLKLSDG